MPEADRLACEERRGAEETRVAVTRLPRHNDSMRSHFSVSIRCENWKKVYDHISITEEVQGNQKLMRRERIGVEGEGGDLYSVVRHRQLKVNCCICTLRHRSRYLLDLFAFYGRWSYQNYFSASLLLTNLFWQPSTPTSFPGSRERTLGTSTLALFSNNKWPALELWTQISSHFPTADPVDLIFL